MTIGDLPVFASANYANSTYGLNTMGGLGLVETTTTNASTPWFGKLLGAHPNATTVAAAARAIERMKAEKRLPVELDDEEEEPMASRRYVRVLIVDPNENIPLDQCVLYAGEEKLTDLTDEELFFDLNIKELLAAHNEKRTKVIDKKVKERTEYLEPAKIRDLKMVVVNVASF